MGIARIFSKFEKLENTFRSHFVTIIHDYIFMNGNFPTKEQRESSTFGRIVPRSTLHENPKIESIMNNFPTHSQVLGVSDGRRFMLYEGHHRMSALVLAKERGVKIVTKLNIALRLFSEDEFQKHFYPQRTNYGQ